MPRALVAALALLLAGWVAPAQTAWAEASDGDVIPGRYIITLHDSAHPRDVAAEYNARAGARVRHVYETVLNGFAGELSHGELQRAENDPRVASIEPDRVVTSASGQATTQTVPDLWGLDRIDQRALPLDDTYHYDRTGAGVTVYVIDTGIRSTHNDFGGRVTPGATAINDGKGSDDCDGHGTHVAGTVGGATYGIAKEVTLVPVRVLDCDGNGTADGVLAGINWITERHNTGGGPSVANMSLGFGGIATSVDDAIKNSIADGVVYAVAAGNSDENACDSTPGSVDPALVVGATDQNDVRSVWNATQSSNWGACVDLFAPGTGILSAWWRNNTDKVLSSGTSMAAPHVAGVAALHLEARPQSSPAQIHAAITQAATADALDAASLGTDSPNLLVYSLFPHAELSVDLDGPEVAFLDQPDTYVVTVTNAGPDSAEATTVDLTLPAGTAVGSATGCELADQTLTCELGDLESTDTATATVVLTPTEVGDRPLAVTAEATAWSNKPSAALARNAYRGKADLSLNLTGPGTTAKGTDVSLTVTASNPEGPDTSEGVIAVLQLPAGLTFKSGTGCTNEAGTVSCVLADLAVTDSAEATILVSASGAGDQLTTASATSETWDPDPATAEHTVTVSDSSGSGGGGGGGGGGGEFFPVEPDPEPEPSPSPSPSPEPSSAEDDGTLTKEVAPGETLTTDPGGAGATPEDPLHASVTSPRGGTVSISRGSTTTVPPHGWELLGMQVDIDAPAATPTEPLTLRFVLDGSVVPAEGSLTVLRNGHPVGPCPGSAVADPNPCLASQRFVGDDLELTVLTSRASAWNFGVTVTRVDCTSPPPAGFADTDPSSVHARAIDCLVHLGVARGTSATAYEPAQQVTRGQMATFIVGALEAAGLHVPAGASTFTDTSTSVHRQRIDQLVATGITQGTTATTYSPHAPVTRAQMATFLVRAYQYVTGTPLPAATASFTDIATSVHRDNISRAAGAGLVAGRTATTYEPAAPVRRDQMATFLVRLLDAL